MQLTKTVEIPYCYCSECHDTFYLLTENQTELMPAFCPSCGLSLEFDYTEHISGKQRDVYVKAGTRG
jgi:hypothetical protein